MGSTEECLTALPSAEPGAIVFRCETMQGRVTVNPLHMQSLQLTVNAIPEYHQWGQDDLQVRGCFVAFFETTGNNNGIVWDRHWSASSSGAWRRCRSSRTRCRLSVDC